MRINEQLYILRSPTAHNTFIAYITLECCFKQCLYWSIPRQWGVIIQAIHIKMWVLCTEHRFVVFTPKIQTKIKILVLKPSTVNTQTPNLFNDFFLRVYGVFLKGFMIHYLRIKQYLRAWLHKNKEIIGQRVVTVTECAFATVQPQKHFSYSCD